MKIRTVAFFKAAGAGSSIRKLLLGIGDSYETKMLKLHESVLDSDRT